MKRFARVFVSASIAAASLLQGGCTEPGETTGIGATAGGVIGAGLGAIVGNQTGNPGSGLAIGAAAGAGTGAMIANAIQAQDETLRAQDEAIERQEQVIRAQKSEIEELRRMNGQGDSGSVRSRKSAAASSTVSPHAMSNASIAAPSLREKDVKPAPAASERGSINWKKNAESETRKDTTASVKPAADTSECGQAEGEVTKANASPESADKLFHLRRALRLCPGNASYHNHLGELYLSLNRGDDARYEFNEALRADPANRQAQANLEYLKTK